MPKISIIIPVYNTEKYLRQCLNSVINQTLKDIEIICINDGSTDNSLEILKEYSQKDSRIKVISKKNSGHGHTMNIGLDNATGEYIGIVESDDYISINMYEELYKLSNDNIDVVKSSFYKYYDTPNVKKIENVSWSKKAILPDKNPFNINDYPVFLSFHPSIWTCIYKKKFLIQNNIKFLEEKEASWVDNLFQVQTLYLAKKIIYINTPFYFYRKRNLKDSADLKDYNIPFKRTQEIYSWIRQNNISNENILACLYKRHLNYIISILDNLKFYNIKNGMKIVKQMIYDMNKNIILHNSYINKKERKIYLALKNRAYIYWFFKQIMELRKYILSIHFTQKNKYIAFCGKYYYFNNKKRCKNAKK
ncbi:MAG: glycosyltransferase [Elusimicrobiota bacterium]|jgi:glycosyltransferase involved in cell wall biosynthesis|nr:glycosyltransferase [Elusimicrobiota bacterium]